MTSISSSELVQFLNDVESNIDDQQTDFKKLILFLFGFTKDKLAIANNDSNDKLIFRLLQTLELVLTKRLHLLNVQLDYNEIKSIYVPKDFHPGSVIMLFDWSIQFVVDELPKFVTKIEILNQLKSFVINVINLICSKLHNFKFIKLIRNKLLKMIEGHLAFCLENLSSATVLQEGYNNRLIIGIHLYTIVNDYDLSQKLLINLVNYQLKFESIARKFWFILNEFAISEYPLFDSLNSIIVLNQINNLVSNKLVTWNQISLLLNWMLEYLESRYNKDLTSLNQSISIALLKLYKLCLQKEISESFVSHFNIDKLIERLNNVESNSMPNSVLKSLHIINYYNNLDESDSVVTLKYQTSNLNEFITAPFQDIQLESVRLEIQELNDKSLSTKQSLDLLDFIVDQPDLKFPHNSSSGGYVSGNDINYSEWINYIRKLTTDDLKNQCLAPEYTLHTLISSLSHFPCIVSGDYNCQVNECIKCGSNPLNKNYYENVDPKRPSISEISEISIMYREIVVKYFLMAKSKVLKNNQLLCCNFLLLVFNLFASYSPPIGNSKNDHLLNFLLDVLATDNNRDARMLVTRILPLYLIQSTDDEILEETFSIIISRISHIDFTSEHRRRHFGESTIKALVELATVTQGDQLCALFIKLIGLFGVENEQHVNYVYNGIIQIAAAKSLTPYKLLSPYIMSTAEDILKNPQMFSKITELLGITKKFFLNRTKDYTTPTLLEYYKHDLIQEIADASNTSKMDLVSKNLSRILAIYLVKDTTINEGHIMNVLSNVCPKYRLVNLEDLFTKIGDVIWYILLQIQISDDSNKITNIQNIQSALEFVSKIAFKERSNVSQGNISSPMRFEYILGEYVLGLVQKFSESVHRIRDSKPFIEKTRSLRAMEFLIQRNINAVTAALGQISTCLQASLETVDFQYLALRCWNALVQELPSIHLISLIDIIISLVFQKFQTFGSKSRSIAIEILKKIYDAIKDKFNRFSLYFLSIPFLAYIQEYNLIKRFRNIKPLSRLTIFQEFNRRLSTSNEYVVKQGLFDLLNYCKEYQIRCQEEYFKEPSLALALTNLVRTILDIASKFKNKNIEISTDCAKVLAVIGSLDSSKFNFKAVRHSIVVIHDFKNVRENVDFLVDLIEGEILKGFWASNDPARQLFSVYAMQNFLKIMTLDSRVLENKIQSNSGSIAVWNRFSDTAKSTLAPLLTSRYVGPIPKYEPLTFPYFKLSIKYESWLVDITLELLKRPYITVFEDDGLESNSKESIFQTCSNLIRDQDVSICQYILKYIALSHIINGNQSAIKDIKSEFLHMLSTDFSSTTSDRMESVKSCIHTVFMVLDYFNEWVSAATQYLSNNSSEPHHLNRLKENIKYVNEFLECIPMDLIAIKSAECDSYERTILYLERCYRNGKVSDTFKLDNLNVATTLQSMYCNINDYDALNGVLKLFSTNNLKEKLSTFQYSDSWSLAHESFIALSSVNDKQEAIENNTKLLKSLSEHGLYDEVLSALSERIDVRDLSSIPLDWALVGLKSSVYLGDISQIEKWLMVTNSIGNPVDVGTLVTYELAKSLKSLYYSNKLEFENSLGNIYGVIGNSLVPSVSSNFNRNIVLMNQLHAIHDLSLIVSDNYSPREKDLILKARLSNVDQDFDAQWKILTFHNAGHKIKNDNVKISENLLYESSLARKHNRLDIATKSIVQAMSLEASGANIEYSKLLWAQGKQSEAIKSLSEIIIEDNLNGNGDSRVQLQLAQWLDESNHLSAQQIITEYNKAIQLDISWEKPYYDLGKYYSKVMESAKDPSGSYEQQTVRHFIKALAAGRSFIFEALPKLITIWLDFAQRDRGKDADRKRNQIIDDIKAGLKSIPTYVWYTAFTQILSRIVHQHQASYEILATIVIQIIKEYPQHALWYVLSHEKSNDSKRKERINVILRHVVESSTPQAGVIENAKELFSTLINIASVKISKSSKPRTLSLEKDFKVLNLMKSFDSLVIPVRSNLEIRLPSNNNDVHHQAFPKSASITFDGFDDNVNIFVSLQMPRQVTVRGSDSCAYRLMLKRDDTRKDAKVVEFTTMVNRILRNSTEARKRNLYVPNYVVMPLAEDKGVIEFVADVQTMKGIISEQRKRMGKMIHEHKLFHKINEAQKQVKSSRKAGQKNPTEELIKLFTKIVQANPPVLHRWFIDQFADPSAWYMARNLYTRTAAVMSMVGYIVGLGDRHCENVLFFKRSGAVLHIDFDCLFEKGATLPTPEIVPFRLTQNMVDAMGICGVDGSFRITCEVTGTLLREHEQPLMNILETLLYDPLLDWKSLQKPGVHLSKVRRKIRGLINEKEGLPMNIHGQVDVLIQEATSIDNLACMYAGWSAYI
ncbi:uncharacterized protein J8A68_002207 [[Candida] subhashii]|uniref:Serine/threonine-protein kinase MEC1 n=1 Tax=[Candida] subhashii TaxID=561895 RepID=A0A8J5UQU3_9ASCO|nr:uncharacterized protein J8A68_002207 [[Candida] subhashii]KAG7664292.1 hypothetical protein J8A68_002207 [[Candida] subhashii]